MLRKFASIDNPETHAYAFDSDAWSNNAQVNTNFRMFQTYGDGLTQHSGDWAVTTDHAADYFLSLAQAMMTDGELADRMLYTLVNRPSAEAIAFCASVVFKPVSETEQWEKKTRYFSIEEKKITTSQEKKYDKRYEKIEKNHDGQPQTIFNMLATEFTSGLERLLMATAIREWVNAQPHGYMELPAMFLGWTKDPQKARDIMHGLEAAQNVTESARLRHAAENTIEAVKRNNARAKKQAEEEVA